MSEYRRGVNDGFKLGLREGRIKAEDEMREQPEQPVACVTGAYAGHFTVVPTNPALVLTTGMALYTHPPQRKPLTDEEMKRVCAETFSYDPYAIARAIERAHGIGGEA
jgi:hypothetical protein